jgi:hypothetical protein
MNAKPATLHRRLAELSPFNNGVTKATKAALCEETAAWREGYTDNVSADELYGCVDWYQYPDQAEGNQGSKSRSVHGGCLAEHRIT